MKFVDLLLGVFSIISFIFAFKITNELDRLAFGMAGILILMTIYLSGLLKEMRDKLDEHSLEIRKLNEKVNIYQKLLEYENRIKILEKDKK